MCKFSTYTRISGCIVLTSFIHLCKLISKYWHFLIIHACNVWESAVKRQKCKDGKKKDDFIWYKLNPPRFSIACHLLVRQLVSWCTYQIMDTWNLYLNVSCIGYFITIETSHSIGTSSFSTKDNLNVPLICSCSLTSITFGKGNIYLGWVHSQSQFEEMSFASKCMKKARILQSFFAVNSNGTLYSLAILLEYAACKLICLRR